jgi:hypothetical protein
LGFREQTPRQVDDMAGQCLLCERPNEPPSEFCSLHAVALENLESAYSSWNRAYEGKLSKADYYAKVLALPETGRSVKEVIQHFRGKGVFT